jgi:hypothetical protein
LSGDRAENSKKAVRKRGNLLSDQALNWVTDKIIPLVVILLVSLMVWVVSQIFAMNNVILEKANENAAKISALELRTSERLVRLEQDISYIRQSVERIEKKVNTGGR